MNVEPLPNLGPGSPTSAMGSSGPAVFSTSAGSLRKERGAIAAQACDTCRSRKQKCDEQRPKCSTCQKFKLDCHYREPQPTKKDKTLVEILDRIRNLEGKIDNLSMHGTYTPAFGSTSATPAVTNPPVIFASETLAPPAVPAIAPSESASSTAGAGEYRYASAVHQMLDWPMVRQLFESLGPGLPHPDVSSIGQDGPAIVLGIHTDDRLPREPAGPMILAEYASTSSLSLPAQSSAGIMPQSGSPLTWDAMQRLSKAYFDTFNFIYPILDREAFVSRIMTSVFNEGFDEGVSSTLAFLVFALGEVAIAGVHGAPINIYLGRPSGIRGGTVERPPGLALFNEARKRMGFALTDCSLENIQVFALAGMYCETCAHHMEFWRMSMTASLACQALITSKPSELTSPRADQVRRIFWYCSIIETYFNLELGLPLTGLDRLADIVGLPDFSGSYSQDDYLANQASHFQEHFASQIALRRLSMGFHSILTNADSTLAGSGSFAAHVSPMAAGEHTSALPATTRQLALQLDQWRGMLPPYLRWQEAQPAEFPNAMPSAYHQQVFSPNSPPAPNIDPPSDFMFTTDVDSIPATYPYSLDIQVALLRTRYYYSKYLLYRPFIYKALHHPEQMTREDADNAAKCLRASLKWPLTMSPPCTHKRLVPCLFFWTQNLLGILVLLHLSRQVPILLRIRTTLCDDTFELEAGETVGLYMDWIRDLKSVDRAAEWAWQLVRELYHVED